MNTIMHVWYLTHFNAECKMFQTKVVEELETRFMFSTSPPPPEIVPFVR